MNRTPRFWFVYAAAWLPYALSYVVVFTVQGGNSPFVATRDALSNIVPAALLGLGVFWVCGRLPWSLHRRRWFFVAQLALALFYALLWGIVAMMILTIAGTLQRGAWSPTFFTGFALQWQMFSGLMIYGTLASLAYVLQVASQLRIEEQRAAQAETRAARAEALRTQAELEALRAQLNPHFLFNTLHSLMALVRYDQSAAEDALERLAGMLRYVMKVKREPLDGADDVPLRDEWAFVQNYLALEKLRLGERLRVETDIEPEALRWPVLAFTLQPLVENAIKHGIAPRARTATLYLAAKLNGEMLQLEVRDDGAGALVNDLPSSQGLGLRLVRQRLEVRYGGAATFAIETTPGAGFAVRIGLPLGERAMESAEAGRAEEESWAFAR